MDEKILKVVGKSQSFLDFLKQIDAKTNAQNTIILSVDKVLREAFLTKMLQAFYCQNIEQRACGECVECKKIIDANNINICYLGEEEGQIKKESITKFLDEAITKSFDGNLKVLVIKNGDGLSDICQNLLLKSLENLPENVFCIIVASGREKLLSTILSRCRIINLPNLKTPLVVSLIGTDERDLRIMDITNHRLDGLLKYHNDKSFDTKYKFALDILKNLESSKSIYKYIKVLSKDKDELLSYFEIIIGIYDMAMRGKIDSIYKPKTLAKTIHLINECEMDLHKNVNINMVVDKMLIGIVKIKSED